MLVELAVKNLGVIESARIPFEPGLVALTGETGAGKTMLVEALNLLAGHKADPTRVRSGADEAVVEGLFVVGDDEWVLRRVVPASGRSRAYLNGELATAATLSQLADELLEVHGQHAQQQLFSAGAHRGALDRFAGIDTTSLDQLRSRVRALETELAGSGGDERMRLREIGLLEYQLDEIDRAGVRVGEDELLASEEDLLSDALAHLDAAQSALAQLSSEGGAVDAVSAAVAALGDRGPYLALVERLVNTNAELTDCATAIRTLGESIEPDPERLSQVQARQAELLELRRKYGDTEAAILEFADEARTRLDELTAYDEIRSRLQDELAVVTRDLAIEALEVGNKRRAAAGELATRIEQELHHLAMPSAEMEVTVEDTDLEGDGGSVEFLISANPGSRLGPLAKVASGGELSRVMLALRLVLSQAPPTTIFDEVDAGIGGRAALEVGRALAELAVQRQVLVVTHLPQVAAFADAQIRIEKSVGSGAVITTAVALAAGERVVELSRMLSGSPDSESARVHAGELLEMAASDRRSRAS